MSTIISAEVTLQAMRHLQKADPLLGAVIERAGPCAIQPHSDYYRSLCDSIIGQQLSVKAAATIKQRFRELFGGAFPEPQAILGTSIEELKSCGLSRSKAAYIQDLASHILDGTLDLAHLESKTNEAIVKDLIAVKGIGEWTAHMFLMFCMGRTDILAVGDLGIRSAIKKLYSLESLPTPSEVTEIAAQRGWHPYETIACWYLWYSLDNAPE